MAEQALRQQPTIAQRHTLSLAQRNSVLGYVLAAPIVIAILTLIVYPFFFAIGISFTDRTVGARVVNFIGLDNYLYLFKQLNFQASVWNTVVLVGFVQSLKLVFGLAIALMLNQQIRGRQLWRGLILLPWAMPAFVAYLTWKLLYDPNQGGAFNMILIGLFGAQVDFLSTKELAMPSVIVATFWRGLPFWVISFLAALQNVSQELYEAAAIDGATAWQRFRHITLPSIRHVILVVVLLSTIWTTNGFENIWLLTQGGPSDATMTFPVLAYFGLQSLRIGEAAAVSVAMLPIFAILAFIVVKLLERENE
jgi:ABC-type sugar transport system permease subunit